jgi:hypothetical protein
VASEIDATLLSKSPRNLPKHISPVEALQSPWLKIMRSQDYSSAPRSVCSNSFFEHLVEQAFPSYRSGVAFWRKLPEQATSKCCSRLLGSTSWPHFEVYSFPGYELTIYFDPRGNPQSRVNSSRTPGLRPPGGPRWPLRRPTEGSGLPRRPGPKYTSKVLFAGLLKCRREAQREV